MKTEEKSDKEKLHNILTEFNNKNVDFLSKIKTEGYGAVLFVYDAAKVLGVENNALEAQKEYESIRCKEELEGRSAQGDIVLELSALANEKYRVTKDICDLKKFPIDKSLCKLKATNEKIYTAGVTSLTLRYRQLIEEECAKLSTNYHELIKNDSRAGRVKICTSVVNNKLPHLMLKKERTSLIFQELLFSNWNVCLRLVTDNIFQTGMKKVYGTTSTLNATLDIYPVDNTDIKNRVTLQFHFIYPGVRPPIAHIQYYFYNNQELERLVTFYTVLYEMIVSEIKSIISRAGY